MRLYFLALATLLIVCVGCAVDGKHDLISSGGGGGGYAGSSQRPYVAPPASMLAAPGPMVGLSPGVTGYPGMGGMGPMGPMMGQGMPPGMPGGMAPMMAMGDGLPPRLKTSQVRFLGPAGMSIGWQVNDRFAENQLTAPARYNFVQGATYRLKLSRIPNREGLVLYPSLHVYPSRPTTQAYLDHNSIPIQLTDEDIDQIQTNNFVTKVVYLPESKYQDLAAGVEELVSTRLAPGQDPVDVAQRQGTIMAVVRVGNMDLEMPGQIGSIDTTYVNEQGEVVQTAYIPDGDRGEHVPPLPISGIEATAGPGVAGEMVMGGPSYVGGPPWEPIAGVTAPSYGYPAAQVGNPIGLAGPAHIPYGQPAGMRSHTIRNLSDNHIPKPTRDLLIDVRHEPGINYPEPVRHMEYTERHPIHAPGEVAWPAWATGTQQGGNCPTP
ncbi:MAG: hypothetical protein R3C01_06090 [Planctomycetaceae bacterium]